MFKERKRLSPWGLSSKVGLLAAMMILLFPVAMVYGGSTAKSLSTNFTIVNLTAVPVAGTVDYYQPNGSVWPSSNPLIDVAANYGQQIIAQYLDPNLSPPGAGSVVLSSTGEIGAVVQVLARNQTATSGAYSNTDPGTTFYIPQIQRQKASASGTVNSQIAIQSAVAAGGSAVLVTVDFFPYPGSGLAAYQKTGISLQPGAALLYDIADEANLVVGWYGSAVVTATGGNIVVASNLFSGGDSLMTFNGFSSTQIGQQWSVPLFTSRLANALSTPVIVQNLSGGDIPAGGIQMICTSAISTPATFTLQNTTAVANNASYAFNPVTDSTITANWYGACKVDTSAAPGYNVVVMVQMRRPGVSAEAAAYEAFLSTGTDTKVVVPLMAKRLTNGFATVATIQNLSATDAPVTLTYTPSAQYVAGGGSAATITFGKTIPANGNLIQNLRTLLPTDVPEVPEGWYGTLLVTATAQPIAAFVQLSNYVPGAAGDTLMAHQAFTQP